MADSFLLFFVGGCATKVVPRNVSANDKANVAIIGCGLIAKTVNVPGFLRDPRCRIVAVCDLVKIAPDYFYGGRNSKFGSEGFVVGSYAYKGKVPDCLRNFKESDLTDRDMKLYRPNEGHDGSKFHESDFLDGIFENRQVASTCEMGHRTISIAHIANICARMQLKSLKWDPKAERFVGAYADEANRFLAVEYHNGWELGV